MDNTVEVKRKTNEALFKGTIVSKFETSACIVLRLGITEPRRRRDGSYSSESNYPKIYFFKNDVTGVENFEKGDRVEVVAHLSAPKKRRPTGQEYNSQAIIGESVKKAERSDTERDTWNTVDLEGEVLRVERVSERTINIIMEAYNKRFYNQIKVTDFNLSDLVIVPGRTIHVSGKIITSRKEKNGETRNYENIVAYHVEDLGIVERKNTGIDYKAEKAAAIKGSYETEPLVD